MRARWVRTGRPRVPLVLRWRRAPVPLLPPPDRPKEERPCTSRPVPSRPAGPASGTARLK
ncbi:hypothetical protein DV515_00004232 [Chloebia gouldiae]|uniref:Uncharacterized protein n=1 Tax=Chloebia gouldiae TaxID=44316 RepID=A0A3L8SSV7_CHLGU|nr:hypothetical protein DV515_00004232 [Chloebia gouldiae]